MARRHHRSPYTSEDVDIDFDIDINVDGNEDVDSHRGGLHRLRRRREHDIEVDVEGMEGGGLLVFGRCRGCGGRLTICMELPLLGTRMDTH